MIKTNSNGDKESPWKIPLLMPTCPISVPPDVNTVLQFITLLLIMVIMFLASLTIPRHFSIHECGTMLYASLIGNYLGLPCLQASDLEIVPLHPFLQPFCSSASSSFLSRCWCSFSPMIPVSSFHIIGRQAIGR